MLFWALGIQLYNNSQGELKAWQEILHYVHMVVKEQSDSKQLEEILHISNKNP